jgi:RNA polymerase sigma-70 factor (ECF subfamily)
MLEDQRLLRRLRGRDKDALRQLYEKYINDLLRVAISLLYDIQTAEDCLHDVFVNFAGNVDELRSCRNIKKYLVSCVANRARDILRRNAKQSDCQAEQSVSPEISCNHVNQLIAAEESARVFSSLAELSYQQREVFVLRVQGGLKFREIADLLDISVNTVQSRYRYGIQKLREVLEKGERK